MATLSTAGTVSCKPGDQPVKLKTYDNGDKVATFSICDRQYVYSKGSDDRQGQFFNIEVRGKTAEICFDRIQRGDKIAATGQLVQRTWNDKLILDVKNANITFLESRQTSSGGSEIPF